MSNLPQPFKDTLGTGPLVGYVIGEPSNGTVKTLGQIPPDYGQVDTWVCPHPRARYPEKDYSWGKLADIDRVRCLYLDAEAESKFALKRQMATHTKLFDFVTYWVETGRGFHLYFVFEDFLGDIEYAQELQRRLYLACDDFADPASTALNRVLRAPNTPYTKEGADLRIGAAERIGDHIDPDELHFNLPRLPARPQVAAPMTADASQVAAWLTGITAGKGDYQRVIFPLLSALKLLPAGWQLFADWYQCQPRNAARQDMDKLRANYERIENPQFTLRTIRYLAKGT